MFLCPLMQVCIVYVVKEVASFWGLRQLMGVALTRVRAQALQMIKRETQQPIIVIILISTLLTF